VALGWNNTLYGDISTVENGDDTLIFIGGNNQVQGNGGNDLILGAGLANQVQGNAGNDIALLAGLVQNLDLGAGDDIGLTLGAYSNLLGGDGQDALYAIGLANTVLAGNGNDFLYTAGVGNFLWGQAGNDVFLSQGMAIQGLLRNKQLNDGTAVINFALSALCQVAQGIASESVPNNLSDYANQKAVGVTSAMGGDGNDTFFSGAQATVADGGNGQDTYHFYLGDDSLTIQDSGVEANQLVIHTEAIRQYGAAFDVSAADFFYNTQNKTLSIVHAGQNYGDIVLRDFDNANNAIVWQKTDGSRSQIDLSRLTAVNNAAEVNNHWLPTSTLSVPNGSETFALTTLYDDFSKTLSATGVILA
jgi:hypothetical protein